MLHAPPRSAKDARELRVHVCHRLSKLFRKGGETKGCPSREIPAAVIDSVKLPFVADFTSTLNSVIGKVPWQSLVDLKVGIPLKRLVRHPNEACRIQARSTFGKMRSAFTAHKALSRSR